MVFYIPHLFLSLAGCRHVGASFERNNPGVMVKECGIRLVFEQDVEEFMETLVQCMLGSPDAYHDFFFIKICRIKLRKEWQALTTEKILVALPRCKGIVPELIDFFV